MSSETDGFSVSVDARPTYDHVEVSGDLDIYTTTRLRDVLSEPGRCTASMLVIDLRGVVFMDSTGLGAIVAARRQARFRGAELRLVCPRGAPLRVIRVTKLDSVLAVFDTLDEAVAAPASV